MLSQNDVDKSKKEAGKSIDILDDLIRRSNKIKSKPITPKGLSSGMKFMLIIIIFSVISSTFWTLIWTGTLKLLKQGGM